MAKEPEFVETLPTKVLTVTLGSVAVRTSLYGPVSPERLAKEQKEIAYRAAQLQPVQRREERVEFDTREFERSPEEEAVQKNMHKLQSGGPR